MIELLIMIALAMSILITAWAVLRLGKVQGLRGYRGVVTYLLIVASWPVGWLLAMVYVPLWIVGCLFVQVIALVYVTKLPVMKAVILSVIYTAITSLLIYSIAAILLTPRFS